MIQQKVVYQEQINIAKLTKLYEAKQINMFSELLFQISDPQTLFPSIANCGLQKNYKRKLLFFLLRIQVRYKHVFTN